MEMQQSSYEIRRLQIFDQGKGACGKGSVGSQRLTAMSLTRLIPVLFGFCVAGCAAQTTPPAQPLSEAICQDKTCRIKVDASACQTGGHPAVDIGKIHIK